MHKIQRFEKIRRQLQCLNTCRLYPVQSRLFATDNKNEGEENRNLTETKPAETSDVVNSLPDDSAKASEIKGLTETISLSKNKPATFASLLRHSPFMNLGDPENKVVLGKIFKVVDSDLYIDFGWKFYCVCPKPRKNGHRFVRGATVQVKIKQLELSTKFLGATHDITLLEADCILLGLIHSPVSQSSPRQPYRDQNRNEQQGYKGYEHEERA